jgi:hypothetical protein
MLRMNWSNNLSKKLQNSYNAMKYLKKKFLIFGNELQSVASKFCVYFLDI